MSTKRIASPLLSALCLFGTCVVACDDDGDGDPSDDGSDAGDDAFDASPPPLPPPPGPTTVPPSPIFGDAAAPGPVPAPADGGEPFPGIGDSGSAFDAGDGFDAGGLFDAGGPDADPLDAGYLTDGGLPDASFYVPEAGVLRPVEEAFDESYLDRLTLPGGFEIAVYAIPGGQTRMLAMHGEHLYVTRPEQGDVLMLADENIDGVAEIQSTVVSDRPMIHGIAIREDEVYLATPTELLRSTIGLDGSFAPIEVLADDLPEGGQHPNRSLGIGPDAMLYVSVGSSCDACAETNPEHASILQVTLDGSSRTTYANGLRNTIGFGWQPETLQLWGMDHGSDWRGNDVPPEELNLIQAGNNYGWPYCYDDDVDPIISDPPGQTKEEYCSNTVPPVLTWQAHEAPIGLTFYDGSAFPAAYQGDAFVAMHGSWNRIPATGYAVVRIDFVDGVPTGITDFVDGFLAADGLSTFGRPAGITTHPDGSLLFSDDSNGVIYRVTRNAAP